MSTVETPAITVVKYRGRGYAILRDGEQCGEVWKMVTGREFGVSLRGIYWSRGEPNMRAGSTATGVKRLKDVPALVTSVLTKLNL